MMRKLSVGFLATALLLSGGLVGVSFGGTGGISEPQVIELSLSVCGDSCRLFELLDPVHGPRGNALVTLSNDALFDVEGDKVGALIRQCTTSDGNRGGTPFVCTDLIKLKTGSHTDAGTVVTTGIYRFGDPSTSAVVGGTGAYENARGYATLETSGGQETLTLNLIP